MAAETESEEDKSALRFLQRAVQKCKTVRWGNGKWEWAINRLFVSSVQAVYF